MKTPVVLITGALTGIGRATALAFAKEGARIVIAGRRDEAGQNLVAELRRLDAEAEYVNADVRREEDCETWSIRPSRASVAWMWPLTTPGPRASPVR
jgi:NAD(P)-dependent dehydrogenase (short-subunit alcohol dehydrogenase family)